MNEWRRRSGTSAARSSFVGIVDSKISRIICTCCATVIWSMERGDFNELGLIYGVLIMCCFKDRATAIFRLVSTEMRQLL